MSERLDIPGEVVDLFVEAQAYRDLFEASVSYWWGARRALKYAKAHNATRQKAWGMVMDLYPDAAKKSWRWSIGHSWVHLVEDDA